MAQSRGISGTGIAVALVGVILTYSGIKGKKISTTTRDLIAGKNPANNTAVEVPIGGASTGGVASAPGVLSPNAKHLTPQQIYSTARQAGFNQLSAITMTAVAMAESGGNPNSYNGVAPDNSYGLTQVNMIGNLGPARRAQFGLKDNAQLFDPLTNMRAAYAISSGGRNFGPWTTFTSGAYLQYLSTARAAANG